MKRSNIFFTLLGLLLSSIILIQPVITQQNNNLNWNLPNFDDKSTSFNVGIWHILLSMIYVIRIS